MLNSFYRLYLLFLIPCSLALGVGFYYNYSEQVVTTTENFESKYDNQTQVYADQILDIENSYELIMRNAVLAIEKEVSSTNINVSKLKSLTEKYNISHLFLIDNNGKFIASTNEDPSKIPNLFSFSKDYISLQKMKDKFLTTPIILPFPEREPHKFLTIWTGSFYIEIGVRIKDIAKKIKNVFDRDSNILQADIEIGPELYVINDKAQKFDFYQTKKEIISTNINYVQSIKPQEHFYSLNLFVSKKSLNNELSHLKSRHITNFLLTIFLLTLVLFLATKFLSKRINKITRVLHKISSDGAQTPELLLNSKSKDINHLSSAINSFAKKYGESKETSAINSIATQVAHDIRSPLEALKLSKKELHYLPQEERTKISTAINRIEEIAYSLLKLKKEESENSNADLQSSIEHILVEKRMQYREHESLIIEFAKSAKNFGTYLNISSGSLKSILSNIISNSAESLNFEGIISIKATASQDNIEIQISDNGTGFSQEYLLRPFIEGYTEKYKGNGLGLAKAKEILERHGGSLEISNQNGAVVKLSLQAISPPFHAISEINLAGYKNVIVLDDDINIHNIWEQRLKEFNLQVEYFLSGAELLSRYQSIPADTLLLSDFELTGEHHSGINYISKLGSPNNSILVTARSEELDISKLVTEQKIRVLPKILIGDVPIVSDEMPETLVLIDDDQLVHLNWKIHLKKQGIKLLSYYSIKEFIKSASSLDRAIRIYLDSNLGNNIKGEVHGIEIYENGFENLRITTGSQNIRKPSWIKGIVGKCPTLI